MSNSHIQLSADESFMLRALELARMGEGLTRPNPPVGAVLVENGNIIAEGWHKKAGGDHAERDCLKGLSGTFPRATLYITLEPCSTHGKTPPCTDRILELGIGRVVVAVEDRNPAHAGRGLDLLRTAGGEVVCGCCEEQACELIAPFETFITQHRPFVTLKLAITLDGRIADYQGASKWITGVVARERVQAMRRRADAIMVGAGTVRADNPSLLPRPAEGRQPWRVVMGSKIPADSTLLTDEAADRTLVMQGDLGEVMAALAQKSIMHVFCEGGGQLAAALLSENLVDDVAFFVAPKLMGSDGKPCFDRRGVGIEDAYNFQFYAVEQLGDDVLLRARTH